ncbi:hypothetical protein [Helicobacter sp. 23-1045]
MTHFAESAVDSAILVLFAESVFCPPFLAETSLQYKNMPTFIFQKRIKFTEKCKLLIRKIIRKTCIFYKI